MVEVGNYIHILILVFTVLSNVALYFILKNKSKKFVYNFLLIWCFCCFALHFLKQFAYMSVDSLRKSTAENICAVSTLVFPFIMLYKKQSSVHDFMFLIGVVGGLAGLIYPTEAIGEKFLCFESLRFLFCHYSIFTIPFLLALLDVYRPKLKNFWKMPIYFLAYEAIICANSALLIVTGLYHKEGLTFAQMFFDRNMLNNSFVFGPTDDMGVVGQIIGSMCPNFMKVDIFNVYGGQTVYWPVIWLAIPSIIIFVPLYFVFSTPFFIVDAKKNKKAKQTEIADEDANAQAQE